MANFTQRRKAAAAAARPKKAPNNLAEVYRQIRDLTVNNTDLNRSEKIAVLQLVQHELLDTALATIRSESLNG